MTPGQAVLLQAGLLVESKLQEEDVASAKAREQGRPSSRSATRRKAERLKQQRGYD